MVLLIRFIFLVGFNKPKLFRINSNNRQKVTASITRLYSTGVLLNVSIHILSNGFIYNIFRSIKLLLFDQQPSFLMRAALKIILLHTQISSQGHTICNFLYGWNNRLYIIKILRSTSGYKIVYRLLAEAYSGVLELEFSSGTSYGDLNE